MLQAVASSAGHHVGLSEVEQAVGRTGLESGATTSGCCYAFQLSIVLTLSSVSSLPHKHGRLFTLARRRHREP